MKSIVKICFLAAFIFIAGFSNAQSLKFGHINTQQLIQVMPEYKAAQTQMDKVAKELEDQQASIQEEYNGKLQSYITKRDSLSDVARANLEQELQDIQQRAESFQQVARQQFNAKQSELMKPIIEKINSTIETVAKENGLIYVFDVQPGTPILYKSNQSTDLFPLCKTKLGI